MQQRRVSLALVRRRLAQVRDQGGLQFHRFLQALEGGAFDAHVDERGQRRVVAGDAPPLQVVQRAANPFGAQARRAHQLVGGDAFVRAGLDQSLGDPQQLAAICLRD